jgi:hypothetical protein
MMTVPGPGGAQIMTVLLLLAAPVPAHAQRVATTFEELQTLVKPGDTIGVTGANGRTMTGRLGELTSSLKLLVRDIGGDGREMFVPTATLSESDVRQIRLERRDSVLNGTLIGLAAVGVPWLLVCAPNDWCYYNEYGGENMLRKAALTSTGMAAGLGALIDASMKQRRTVFYRPPGQTSGVTISPLLSKSGPGMQMSVRF